MDLYLFHLSDVKVMSFLTGLCISRIFLCKCIVFKEKSFQRSLLINTLRQFSYPLSYFFFNDLNKISGLQVYFSSTSFSLLLTSLYSVKKRNSFSFFPPLSFPYRLPLSQCFPSLSVSVATSPSLFLTLSASLTYIHTVLSLFIFQ